MWSVGYYINHLSYNWHLLKAINVPASTMCWQPTLSPVPEFALSSLWWSAIDWILAEFCRRLPIFWGYFNPASKDLSTNHVDLLPKRVGQFWFITYDWFIVCPLAFKEITLTVCNIVFHCSVFSIITLIKVNHFLSLHSKKVSHHCMVNYTSSSTSGLTGWYMYDHITLVQWIMLK